MSIKIPKIILQTSISKQPGYIVNTIKHYCPGWEYFHFTDVEIIEFFNKYKLEEFPNITEKFNGFSKGQHKADLFRYYFLYIHGGMFLDSDAMIETNVENIIQSYDSVYVKSYMEHEHLFNGFIITPANSPIIYEALKHAYNTDDSILENKYHYFCVELWDIYKRLDISNVKIYHEQPGDYNGYGASKVLGDSSNVILRHYWYEKTVPNILDLPDISFDKYVYVGSSNTNPKIIPLTHKNIIGHNLLNKQNPEWRDTFDIRVENNQLIVLRTDVNEGWGQPVILPIKKKEILIYNGFPFHYEMIGFILDFCNTYDITATLVNTYMDNWIDVYSQKYTFHYKYTLPRREELQHYLLIFVLTDDDMSFPNDYVNNNVVCIDHVDRNRRENIKYHIPITAYNENIQNYILPTFKYVDYDTKMTILQNASRPIITILGNSTLPDNMDMFSLIQNFGDFDIYIINRSVPRDRFYASLPNVYLFENIMAEEMMRFLVSSTYVFYYPNTTANAYNQINNKAITAAMPMSFSTGCKLVIPKKMNTFLQLTSVVTYENEPIWLETAPSFVEVFEERNRLIQIRDRTMFELPHMKLFMECVENM